MSASRADLAIIIRQEFGRPGEGKAKPFFRMVRRALFAGSPAAFPAWIRLTQLAFAYRAPRFGTRLRTHVERRFACYVHPKAEIGPGLQAPHPTGIVLGAGSVLGPNVTIYQNVTLGSANRMDYLDGNADYPRIGAGAIIYAGAVLIGGITIGAEATVGANAVVLKDVPDGCVAVGVPAVVRPARRADAN